jgi:hypothetical protein
MCNESSRTIERAVAEPFAIRHLARSVPSTATATSLNNLATLLLTQGDLMAAMPLFEYIHPTALDPKHPETAAALCIRHGRTASGQARGAEKARSGRGIDRVTSAGAGLPRRRSGL